MYDKDKIHNDCINAIREEGLTFFNEISLYVEPSLSTLYEWKLEQSDAIKSELAKNRLTAKKKMRNKWQDSDNATLQLAAYKLIADKEELAALTMNKVDADLNHSGGVQLIFEKAQSFETK